MGNENQQIILRSKQKRKRYEKKTSE